MNKIVIGISGKTCSGKTYLLNRLLETGKFSKLVTSTSRNPRVGEVEGEDYHFITPLQAEKWVHGNGFFEHITFGTEENQKVYGLTYHELDRKIADTSKIPCVILTPAGQQQYEFLLRKLGIQLVKVLIDAPESVLMERLVSRTTNEVVENYLSNQSLNPDFVREKITNAIDRARTITTVESGWAHVLKWDAVFQSGRPAEDFVKIVESFSNL